MLAVVTLSLTITGQLALYINPESTWFTAGMSVLILVGAVASFALPLGAEDAQGHHHGDPPDHASAGIPDVGYSDGAATGDTGGDIEDDGRARRFATDGRGPRRRAGESTHTTVTARTVATAIAGVLASAVVVATLLLPPASLSAELALSRDLNVPPLFAGSDVVALAQAGDTAEFGVGDWSAVFATSTNPEAFEGDPVTLTGFVTPGEDGFGLTRLVITHCVIDAQPATVAVSASATAPETGQWVSVTGTVRSASDGTLTVHADQVKPIEEPTDPYEY